VVDSGWVTPGAALSRGLLVVFGEHGGAARMLDLTARLSLRGPLYLLDCGNRSNMYRVARTLRTLTDDPVAVMRNIRLSRAFTCYQVVALLEKVAARPPRRCWCWICFPRSWMRACNYRKAPTSLCLRCSVSNRWGRPCLLW